MIERIRRTLSGLTCTDWAYIHFKAALGLLWIIPLTQIAYLKTSTSPWFIVAWGALTSIGFIVSVTGLIMSAQKYETRRRGFRVEMTGLWLMMLAPAVYGMIQIGLLITTGHDRWIAIAFAYIICSAIVPRMVMIKAAAKSRTVIYKYTESHIESPRVGGETEGADE
ncbi:membrane protein [Arthrobacter phage Bauer]|uniref:Membrane protein n=1 Tax=Arthrobacter phage Bauer TaxID=2985648 RepID=A0A9E7V2I3_9CAUD|nr:membrane protein [Arthrobacter phage Bauer]UUG69982.1 membrane protein [Arthrobacter phage Zucker]UYM26572.1 membrane protein [Arthrobacter phage Bauer]